MYSGKMIQPKYIINVDSEMNLHEEYHFVYHLCELQTLIRINNIPHLFTLDNH